LQIRVRLGGAAVVCFEDAVLSFVAPILFRMAGFDALGYDALSESITPPSATVHQARGKAKYGGMHVSEIKRLKEPERERKRNL
jgi:hypothetical protein